MKKTVYQILVSNLFEHKHIALSIYEDAEQANSIAKAMNRDFAINRMQRTAFVVTQTYYYKIH